MADEGGDESGAGTSETTGTTGETDEATAAAAGGPDGAGTEVVRSESDEEGEFVVRFFDGGTSVGAVGGSAPMSALLQATELLERQRALLAGLDTPWAPGDDCRVVLTDEPVGDGPTRQLPTGHYLATDLTDAEARTTVEGLASAAGLRVMFQGDWPDE